MRIMALSVSPDEPCMGLFEGPKLRPVPGTLAEDYRWVQQVWVVRDDTIACYEQDFGSYDDYEMITPIFIPNSGTDSVAVLQAIAEKNRHDTYWQTRAAAQLEASTLISDLIEQEAKIHAVIHNRTSSGPYVTNQRNGWSRQVTQRRLSANRQRATGIIPQRSR